MPDFTRIEKILQCIAEFLLIVTPQISLPGERF